MNQSIFRAYDIRGKYPSEVNSKTFFEIGFALGRYFIRVNQRRNPRLRHGFGGQARKSASIFVGQDVRLSSPQLKKSFVNGLENGGLGKLKIVDIGLSTTPLLNFCVNKFKAFGGAIITASHDPKEYNGLKVLGPEATILSGKDVLKIMKK